MAIKKNEEVYEADFVWAASAFAHRINDGYVRFVEPDPNNPDKPKELNRNIIRGILNPSKFHPKGTSTVGRQKAPTIWKVAKIDYKTGKEYRDFIKGLCMRAITCSLNEFEQSAYRISCLDQISSKDYQAIGLIASMPQYVARATKRESVESIVSEHYGKISERLEIEGKILTVNYSNNYNCYFVTMVTEKDNVLFFSY
ncbi:uncharacterized protein METZ01_LOCUS181591, partial [marine metagenome]